MRSASDTTPVTRPLSSITGTALIRYSASVRAISLNGASVVTAITGVVITDRTVGYVMAQADRTHGPP
ncbi:hypothetical protein [Kutzneria kofuensis]|uniref:hypothetical protein n=1 Tax=Kutzneria kofuensis TaxID=103725 RepID=UPI0031EBF8BC